jgi:hypothetical protein
VAYTSLHYECPLHDIFVLRCASSGWGAGKGSDELYWEVRR